MTISGNIFIKESALPSGDSNGSPTPLQGSGVGIKKPQNMKPSKKKKKYRAAKAIDASTILKDMVVEGDFVIVSCEDETHVGIVQYVMTEGMLGISSSDYAIEASLENPAVLVRTLELEEDEGIWEESEYLVGEESKMVTKIEPLALEVELVANGYADCGCPTCEAMNVDCENCPVCSPTNSDVAMAMYDSSIGKADPCWDGYVQRGMKEQDGVMVPNCVPVEKTESLFSGIGKDYTKSSTYRYQVGEDA